MFLWSNQGFISIISVKFSVTVYLPHGLGKFSDLWYSNYWKMHLPVIYGTKYSRMDHVKFVEDGL